MDSTPTLAEMAGFANGIERSSDMVVMDGMEMTTGVMGATMDGGGRDMLSSLVFS